MTLNDSKVSFCNTGVINSRWPSLIWYCSFTHNVKDVGNRVHSCNPADQHYAAQ